MHKNQSDALTEQLLVSRRIQQLEENPIQGNYDIAHLKEVHRYIFQDLPRAKLWEYDVPPGEFRTPTETWCKPRILDTVLDANGNKESSYTSYSRMDSKAIAKLEAALAEAKPENFKGLSPEEFSEKMAKLYGDLDYAHPFREGNSRTLRTFTEQLANEAGHTLCWEKLNSKEDRDLLYIARDRELVIRAESAVRNNDHDEDVFISALTDAYKFRDYKSLAQLIERNLERVQTVQLAPRHDISKNPAEAHILIVERKAENVVALRQNPELASRAPEDLEKLAYWRGVCQEKVADKDPAARDEALAKFDSEAKNPAFLEALEKAHQPEAKEHSSPAQQQKRGDDTEQSR